MEIISKIIFAILVTFVVSIVVLIFIGMSWDFQRIMNVSKAQTESEIASACSDYQLASIKNIPSKCLPYVSELKVITE